jgi:hypothetical protein
LFNGSLGDLSMCTLENDFFPRNIIIIWIRKSRDCGDPKRGTLEDAAHWGRIGRVGPETPLASSPFHPVGWTPKREFAQLTLLEINLDF